MTAGLRNSVSVIIVAYNSAATIRQAILSAWAAGATEVVVVDHGGDKSADIARSLGATVVRQSNCGFAAGCNLGARVSVGSRLVFLNPDARLYPAALQRALAVASRQPAVGVVGLLLVSEDGAVEHDSYGRVVTLWSLVSRHFYRKRVPIAGLEVGWVSAGAVMIKREAFSVVGGFDERFFMYWEDVDLCRQLQRAGWRVMLSSQAMACHEGGASGSKKERTRYYDVSADRYFKKHYAAPIWLTHRIMRYLYRRLR